MSDKTHHSPLLERFVSFQIRFAWPLLICGLILTGLCVKPAIGLLGSISTELSQLLPDSHPTVALAKEIKRKFTKKGESDLIVVVNSPDAEVSRQAVDKVVEFLNNHPEVDRVRHVNETFEFFNDRKLMYVELEDLEEIRDRLRRRIQQEKLGSLYIDFTDESPKSKEELKFDDLSGKYQMDYARRTSSPYFTNATQRAYSIWTYPLNKDSSLASHKKYLTRIKEDLQSFQAAQLDPTVSLAFVGAIQTRVDEYVSLTNDLKKAGVISGLGIFLLLFLYFRSAFGVSTGRILVSILYVAAASGVLWYFHPPSNWAWVLKVLLTLPFFYLVGRLFFSVSLIFIPLITGMLMGFAGASIFVDQLNIVTSFLFSILTGLGIDIGIHMFARFVEDREARHSLEDSIKNCLVRAGRSSALAAVTTCASFFILLINDFRGFSEFGIIAGIGLSVTLLHYLILLPAILVVGHRIGLLKFKPIRHDARETFVGHFPRFPWAKGIVIAGVVLTVGSIFLIPRVDFEWNSSLLKIQIPETAQARLLLKEINGRVNKSSVIKISGEEEARLLKNEFKRMKKENPGSLIDYFRSSYDLYPENQPDKMRVLAEIDELLSDDALNVIKGKDRDKMKEFHEMIKRTKTFRKEEIPQSLYDSFYGKGEFAGEQVGVINALPNLELDDGRNAIKFYNEAHKVTVGGKTFLASSDSMVFADVLTTMFKDTEKTAILSLLALAILVYLDFRNVPKTVLVLGSLCAGVFWMLGTMALFGLKFNFYNMIIIPTVIGMGEDNSVHLVHRFEELKRQSVMRALMSSGGAALMASLTTMMGYSGLLFAHHPGLYSIGVMSIVGMGTCMLSSLVFLPAILQWMVNRKKA